MKATRAAALLVLIAPSVVAQVPPTCFGFNMAPGAAYTYMLVTATTPLTIYFTAPQTVAADQVALFESMSALYLASSLNVAIHAVSPGTSMLINPPLATASSSPPYFFGFDWIARTLSAPVAFVAGSPYAIVCTPPVTPNPFYQWGVVGISTSPAQTPPTLLTFTGGGSTGNGPLPPGTTQLGFRFGFQGPSCGPKLAELHSGGAACGGTPPPYPYPLLAPETGLIPNAGLTPAVARPALGQSMVLRLVPSTGANPTMPVALYWSFGTNLAGSPISPSCPCVHYLDPTSLATLAAAGLEPLATPTWWNGAGAWFVLPVPNILSLVGTPIAIQGVLADPGGVPSGVPGLNIRLSNSLTLLPGL